MGAEGRSWSTGCSGFCGPEEPQLGTKPAFRIFSPGNGQTGTAHTTALGTCTCQSRHSSLPLQHVGVLSQPCQSRQGRHPLTEPDCSPDPPRRLPGPGLWGVLLPGTCQGPRTENSGPVSYVLSVTVRQLLGLVYDLLRRVPSALPWDHHFLTKYVGKESEQGLWRRKCGRGSRPPGAGAGLASGP